MAQDSQQQQTKPNAGSIKMPEVETAIGREGGGSVYVGEDRPNTAQTHESSGSVEVGGGKVQDDANDPRNKPQPQDDKAGDQPAEGDDQQQQQEGDADKDTDQQQQEGALPKFDPENADVVKAFDEHYKPNGQFDMNKLGAEWWQNAQTNGDAGGSLNEDTYAYFEKQGYSKDMIKQIEQGQFALTQQTWGGYFSRAGGKENFDKAFAWATDPKNPGYTQAQRDAFNRAIDAGGESANDAIDLLMSRHSSADQRKVNPGASVERGAGGSAPGGKRADVFNSRQEWIDARKEAGKDVQKQQAVSDKFRRSPGAKGW